MVQGCGGLAAALHLLQLEGALGQVSIQPGEQEGSHGVAVLSQSHKTTRIVPANNCAALCSTMGSGSERRVWP
jgi:hypothetical protein